MIFSQPEGGMGVGGRLGLYSTLYVHAICSCIQFHQHELCFAYFQSLLPRTHISMCGLLVLRLGLWRCLAHSCSLGAPRHSPFISATRLDFFFFFIILVYILFLLLPGRPVVWPTQKLWIRACNFTKKRLRRIRTGTRSQLPYFKCFLVFWTICHALGAFNSSARNLCA